MGGSKNISDNKSISLYWKCQLLGWGTVSLYWAYTVYTRDHYGVFFTFLNYVLDIVVGVLLTHLYRYFAKKLNWNALNLGSLAIRVIPSVILLSVAYMELVDLKWHLYWVFVENKDYTLWYSLSYWNPVFITGLRLMAIWILAYHLYHYHQNKLETAKQNAELLVIAKQAQLDNLSKQLNPHFLFNSLNSIKSLIIENTTMARRAVDLLSDILRTSLYEKDVPFITIKEELELVKDYVDLEKIRFEERLNMSIEMDSELENYLILPLSIQLLVENGIKHGIDKRINGGTIQLTIKKTTETIEIIVQNPGKIAGNNAEAGIGIKNLTKRLQLHYDGGASFELQNIDNDLVRATLIIPIRKK
ncbi:histidine kinase [Prolixibacter bellariivorans]|uniref:Histidine kinase n=1 Tax=Prolixibacter bellariivorans TaxID=314319 RepID=A0A5M4B175_9BACT|nr:histidine kinase [Prolixibacter bellariivorans]GET33636.1 histidine kinase [Prolixibacter bellariivorans]